MSILAWIVIGLLAGVIANVIFPGPSKGGWLGAMILGIVGAIVGGFLGGVVTGEDWTTGVNVSTLAVSVIGALVLLFLYNAVAGRRSIT